MFKNVLAGVDGRPGGRDAIKLASQLRGAGGTLTLVHVDTHAPRLALSSVMRDERREASRQLLRQARSAAEAAADLACIEAASAGRGLHEQAERQAADLLVVGSCSRGSFGRVMLGDDTRAALNGAPCAVAIASSGYAERSSVPEKIGVGYDATPQSEVALAVARELASAFDASLFALQVVSRPAYSYASAVVAPLLDDAETMVDRARSKLSKLSGVAGDAVYGVPGEELAALGGQLDLLVIGSRNYGPVRRLVVGSTASYLERHARCSLLVLRKTARDEHALSDNHARPARAAKSSVR